MKIRALIVDDEPLARQRVDPSFDPDPVLPCLIRRIWAGWEDAQRMNVENIKTALKEGIPFQLTTAAGETFRVEDEFQVALNPKRGVAILLRKDGSPTLVSLLTITSLEYLSPNQPKRKPRSK